MRDDFQIIVEDLVKRFTLPTLPPPRWPPPPHRCRNAVPPSIGATHRSNLFKTEFPLWAG